MLPYSVITNTPTQQRYAIGPGGVEGFSGGYRNQIVTSFGRLRCAPIRARGVGRSIHSSQQGLLAQVRVPLRRLHLGVSEYFRYLIDRPARIDEVGGHAVTQVMHPHVGQRSRFPSRVPAAKDTGERQERFRIGHHKRTTLKARQLRQHLQSRQ